MKQTIIMNFLSVLLVVITILGLIQAQDQSGFISLDCGLPKDVSYSAVKTGINYISDVKFIDTGVSKRNKQLIDDTKVHSQQLQYLRSFPNGVRNCYKINVTTGTQYLIRTTFYYGNYDNLKKAPQFDLYLGANLWGTVTFPDASSVILASWEIIYTPSQDYIQPCLVNTGNGTPFISAIELRPLNNTIYVTESAKSVSSLWYRYNLGSDTSSTYRYKDDIYDRIWPPYGLSNDWRRLSASLNNDVLVQNDYKLPSIVMSTAVAPVNDSAPLHFEWEADNENHRYNMYLHFNEVENLARNETRAFNITLNNIRYGPEIHICHCRKAHTLYSSKPVTGSKRYNISLLKTENSTLPPILNAIEIYQVLEFSQSETLQDDVNAITNIKNAYGVTRNWLGDPCAPVQYMWEGLNCSIDDNNIPRITSLDLSSSELTGHIASSISKLTMLQHLDLSNNSCNGHLPDFLIQLRSLKVLNVEKNKLTGLVPSELIERSKRGSLSLRNLVSLIGYCDEDEIKALVYEYMANGNLQQHLIVENSNILKWNERLSIAVDSAHGLDYLHNGCKPPIIHRDLKPSNILLDENMHAKIADFGLSRAFDNDIDSHISTRPAGTIGYADPELRRTTVNTNKRNDVYSFGIVLFVLITGRQAIVREGEESIHILEWVIPIVERGDIQNVVDPRLEGEFSINSAWKVVEIAMSCTSPNAVERPDMSLVLADLKECLSMDMVQRNYGNSRAIDESVSCATISDTTISAR